MNPFAISLAYKYVALLLMLGEVNFFASKTGLNSGRPFAEAEVREGSHVGPPKTNDFSGSILTDKYFFGFGWGHLANFHRNDFRSDSDATVRERNSRLSKLSSLIDTNGAYQLATNWLGEMGVDLAALHTKYKLNILQWRSRPEQFGEAPVMLPVYQVEWRGSPFPTKKERQMAVVTVTVLGTTKELVEYHLLDDSLFLRPRLKVPNPEKLLSMSDSDFRALDPLQRSNLVSEPKPSGP